MDDETSMRRVPRKILEQGRMDILETGSAGQALDLADQGPGMDAVATDVLMPGISGVDFSDQLHRAPRLRAHPRLYCPRTIVTGDEAVQEAGPLDTGDREAPRG